MSVPKEPAFSGKALLTGLKTGLAFGLLFASAESIYGTLLYFSWYRARGIGFALKPELYSLAVYVPAAVAFGMALSIPFVLFRKRVKQESIIAGIFTWLLVFLVMESFVSPMLLWEMFVQAVFFSIAGLLCALGVAWFIARLETRNNGITAFRATLVAALTGFALNHALLTLFLKTKLGLHPLIIAVGLLSLSAGVFWLFGLRGMRANAARPGYTWIIIFILALASPLAAFKKSKPPEPSGRTASNPMNIIVVVSDACRTDAIGIYGGKNSTPRLDRMAEQGVLFTNAISQAPWTLPSMLSAVSSRYPGVIQRNRFYKVPASVTTLPETLYSSGYFTKLLMGNYSLGAASGFIQGFEEYEIYNQLFRLQRLLPLPMFVKLHYLYCRAFDLSLVIDLTELISRKAGDFLGSEEVAEPFLLWLHYMDPHTPYDPPARFVTREFDTKLRQPFSPNNPWHIKGDYIDAQGEDVRIGMIHTSSEDREFLRYLYDAEVRYMDENMGFLLDLLREKGLADRTLVIFTADHGEEFWDHGDWGHGQSLYQELVKIPLIMWGAGLGPARIEEPVELIDVAPTILDLVGLPVPAEFQGRSLLDRISEKSAVIKPAFSEATRHFEEMKAVQDGKRKLIWRQERKRYESYDLIVDGAEKNDIYYASDTGAKSLEGELWPWADENLRLRRELSGLEPSSSGEEEIKRRLKALGYIK